MITVLQVFRKKNPVFFSIEKVFSLIQPVLETKVQVKNISLPYFTSGLLSIVKNLYFLKKRRFNGVFHITGDVHYALLALPASRTVLTIHDCVFLHTAKGFKRRILKWLFLDMPVSRAVIVTTISEFSKQEIVQFTGCAPDKIVVIPNPVNNTIFFQEKPFNSVRTKVLFIGTTPNKNLERVILALDGLGCHLCLLGKLNSTQKQLLSDHRQEFSVSSNISEYDLANMYFETDIVLFPSTFEGFGLPILEGQQAGRIVITSNLDPMQTVAGGGALLVDPYSTADIRNAILTAIENSDMRNAIIQKGFENIKKYNAYTTATAYHDVYEKLMKSNHPKTFE